MIWLHSKSTSQRQSRRRSIKTAQVAQVGLQAQVTNAQAQLDQAKTTQNYSIISAPMNGQLGEVTPRVGQYVAAGSQLLYLIPQQTWVIANFKETQIAKMRIGQRQPLLSMHSIIKIYGACRTDFTGCRLRV